MVSTCQVSYMELDRKSPLDLQYVPEQDSTWTLWLLQGKMDDVWVTVCKLNLRLGHMPNTTSILWKHLQKLVEQQSGSYILEMQPTTILSGLFSIFWCTI